MGLNFPSSTGTQLVNDHFNYDGDLRPSSTTATWSASNTNFFNKSLTYDPVGNVVSANTSESAVSGQSNSGGGEVENFCYDEENRLVWAGNGGTQPAAGNGTCGTATTWSSLNGASYNSSYSYTHLGQVWQGPLNGTGSNLQYLYCSSGQPHQVTDLYAAGTTCANRTNASYSASYDSWGNETTRTYSGTTATLSYDKLDELVQWNAGSTNQAWYAYDDSGERTVARSITSSGTSLTVYAFGLEEHVYNGTGSNVSNTYYYTLGGRLIGKFDGTNTQYYLTDAQGSVLSTFSNVVNTTIVLGNHVYGPYGNALNSSGSMGTAKGFTGQYQDPTGLDYYNARYYDPVVGRFVSADTVQDNMRGMDPYAYVNGNPETTTDPTGHSPAVGPEDDPDTAKLAMEIADYLLNSGISVFNTLAILSMLISHGNHLIPNGFEGQSPPSITDSGDPSPEDDPWLSWVKAAQKLADALSKNKDDNDSKGDGKNNPGGGHSTKPKNDTRSTTRSSTTSTRGQNGNYNRHSYSPVGESLQGIKLTVRIYHMSSWEQTQDAIANEAATYIYSTGVPAPRNVSPQVQPPINPVRWIIGLEYETIPPYNLRGIS